jgi:hypothetical protein
MAQIRVRVTNCGAKCLQDRRLWLCVGNPDPTPNPNYCRRVTICPTENPYTSPAVDMPASGNIVFYDENNNPIFQSTAPVSSIGTGGFVDGGVIADSSQSGCSMRIRYRVVELNFFVLTFNYLRAVAQLTINYVVSVFEIITFILRPSRRDWDEFDDEPNSEINVSDQAKVDRSIDRDNTPSGKE